MAAEWIDKWFPAVGEVVLGRKMSAKEEHDKLWKDFVEKEIHKAYRKEKK